MAKAKKAKVGASVEFIRKDGSTGVGKVHAVNDKGEVQEIKLPDGEIIEAVGLILSIIKGISRLFLVISSIFSKKSKAKLRALRNIENAGADA